MYELQRDLHLQSIKTNPRVDMTDIMRYSINDTVVLWRMEEKTNYIESQTAIIVESNNLGVSHALDFTVNFCNQIE
jgi:hypothetical protein